MRYRVARQGVHGKTVGLCEPRQFNIIKATAEPGDQVHSAWPWFHGDAIAEHLRQVIRQRPAPGAVQGSHALEMSREVACRYEIGDDTLFERCMPQISQANGACENVNQRFRRDEISKPKARIQNFAEASGIEHPLIAIEALESRQGPADVAKFAVVIILNDPGARLAGPRQKGKPPRQR